MHSSTFTLVSADGLALFVYRWLPEATPKAVVQIAHGLVEHAGRYARLAEALTRAGYVVYAGDHRGHGRTAPAPEDLGFFAERDGWRKCVDDLWRLNQRIATDHPGLPTPLTESVRSRRRIRGHHRKLSVGRLFLCHRSRAPMGAMPSEQKLSAFQ